MAKASVTTAGNEGYAGDRERAARADTRLRGRIACGGDRRRVRDWQA